MPSQNEGIYSFLTLAVVGKIIVFLVTGAQNIIIISKGNHTVYGMWCYCRILLFISDMLCTIYTPMLYVCIVPASTDYVEQVYKMMQLKAARMTVESIYTNGYIHQ